ncbi:ketopantoate reductase family protein [Anatilimnocola floriformis]|uniref:ketopantoate reductase family protein n=1 Tax=Anatilimnocola floriformis TaxID=2948575 RepID=UPI0020C54B04|nr:2-dehydropantoate 2-reductase N-terminal domain-containing protein [Anatilimnocola floriformis]
MCHPTQPTSLKNVGGIGCVAAKPRVDPRRDRIQRQKPVSQREFSRKWSSRNELHGDRGGPCRWFGATLAHGGVPVAFVARERTSKHARARPACAGCRQQLSTGERQCLRKSSGRAAADVVLLAVKTYSTEEAGCQLCSVVGPKTVVITVQNGIDNDERARAAIGGGQIFRGNALIVTRRAAPGRIEQTGGPRKFLFNDPSTPSNERLQQIAQAFRKAGVDATASDDILRVILDKVRADCCLRWSE